MAQFARPDAVVSIGTFTDDAGGTTDIFQAIDETVASDVDYVKSASIATGGSDVAVFGLSNVTDPNASANHTIRGRVRRTPVGGDLPMNLTVRLLQTATEIATWTYTSIADTFTAFSETLSGAQADAITDYTALRVEFSVAPNTTSAAATAFLARASGLDATHIAAYTALLNGLTDDGFFDESGNNLLLDALYVFATEDTTNAVLNLMQNAYNLAIGGSPTFTADQGFAGVDGSTTVYLATGFVPSTAGGLYAQNSACMFAWSNTDGTPSSGGAAIGTADATSYSHIFPEFSDGNTYWRINIALADSSPGVATASSNAFFLANRSGSTASQYYRNTTQEATDADASAALCSEQFLILAANQLDDAVVNGSGKQYSAAGFGGSLNSTQVTALFNRLAAYRTAVGL